MSESSKPRLLICAPGSGSGKTLITCALLRIFQKRGYEPCSFKCGPDYIDPMFHKKVLGISSGNLDLFMAGTEGVQNSLSEGIEGSDIAVIEGVMGFFDGMGSCSAEGSSYDLCKKTGTPAILVVNCRGMSRSVLALIKGFLEYEPDTLCCDNEESDTNISGPKTREKAIKGVILNNISPMVATDISEAIEKELGLPVIGYLPKLEGELLESRHLGLVMPDEVPEVLVIVDKVANELEKSLDVERLLEIAGTAENVDVEGDDKRQSVAGKDRNEAPSLKGRADAASGNRAFTIAVAMDEAFCFYYKDNLRYLEKMGARLKIFSPIHDEHLPEADGIIIGGGYPELHLKELSDNVTMRLDIRRAAEDGMPILAECGGFLYLKESFRDDDDREYAMAGVLPGQGFMTGKLGHFGYVNVTANEDTPYLKTGSSIRGHEFHYCDTTDNGGICRMTKPSGNRSWLGFQVKGNVFAGFAHLYYPSSPEFIENFLRKIEEC